MATTTTTSPTNLSNYEAINNLVRDSFLANFEPRKYLMRFSTAPMNIVGYDKAVRPAAPRLDITPAQAKLQEGITPTSQDFELTSVEVDTEQYGMYYKMSDRFLKVTANLPSITAKASQNLADATERLIDRIIQDEVMDNVSEVLYAAPSAGGTRRTSRANLQAGDVMTFYDLEEIAFLLDKAEAPVHAETGTYVGIIAPEHIRQIRQESGAGVNTFAEAVKYNAPEKLLGTQFVGQIAGISVFSSQNLKTYNSAIEVFPALFFGGEAYGMAKLQDPEVIFHLPGSGGTNDPLNQRATIGMKIDFASTILQQESLVRREGAGV